jgi:hypothetical protein
VRTSWLDVQLHMNRLHHAARWAHRKHRNQGGAAGGSSDCSPDARDRGECDQMRRRWRGQLYPTHGHHGQRGGGVAYSKRHRQLAICTYSFGSRSQR